jgi:2-keto-4-pentenoate hydratase/2-oxohepta-3-ene-1,7-dioic acid hydratase in catechol pathway
VAHYLCDDASGFALGRFRTPSGIEVTGLAVRDRIRVLEGDSSVVDLLTAWDSQRDRLSELAQDPSGDWYAQADLTPLVPFTPVHVLQAGANYRKHVVDIVISEMDDDGQGRSPEEKRAFAEDMMDTRAATGSPYIFLGSPRAMTDALGDIILPVRPGAKHDWELELGVLIGRRGRHVPRADAMNYVAGYTIVNDISSRDVIYRDDLKKIGTDWLAAKNSPTFLPTGPVVVPSEFVPDPMGLRIILRHNGIVRQDELTKDMIFDIPRLIEYASDLVELHPGDLLLTGSPAGNGAHWGVFMKDGDVIESEITGLGRQRNICVDERSSQ